MSESNPVRIFVVHAFKEHQDYLRIFEYLESRPNFFYQNCSKPDASPPGNDSDRLKEELRRQIDASEIVIFPVAMFVDNPVLVTFQVDTAKRLNKPVLAVKAFGDSIAIKKSLLDKADDIVDWNNRAISEAVKRLARHDNSGQWEVIEFKLD